MLKMNYCKICILPNTRPQLKIDVHGNCNCKYSFLKKSVKKINWKEKYKKFSDIVKTIKKKNKPFYDCLIPVSGGKDSTWQVIECLKIGLNPLCVTWKTPVRSEIGEYNLKNLINLGVDHIDFTINPKIEKYLILKSFKKMGNIALSMHMAIHGISLNIATNFKIPLIVYGENSANEYGGTDSLAKSSKLTYEWLQKYGVTNNTTIDDWTDDYLTKKKSFAYTWPKNSDFKSNNINAIFLGQYIKWDPNKTFKIAKKHGFKRAKNATTGLYNFADIDDQFIITIHHWMKWYKFGFTRLWDNLSIEIKEGKISRKQAIEIVKNPEKIPLKEINLFCKFLSISLREFFLIAEKFRNQKIWYKDKNKWKIKDFLIKDYKW